MPVMGRFTVSLVQEAGAMLVLTRKRGEQLIVGDDVVISVEKITRNRASLGVQAPPHVLVMRKELLESTSRPQPDQESTPRAP